MKKQVTAQQLANLTPFEKGDKRINRKGRISNFAQLRRLAQDVGNRDAGTKKRKKLDPDGQVMSIAEDLLQKMATSKNPKDRENFLAYMVGKPLTQLNIPGGEGNVVTWKALIVMAQGQL